MLGYFLEKKSFPSCSCSVTDLLPLQYAGLNVRLSQNEQPPKERVPSLLGQESPASTESFCTFPSKWPAIHLP